MTGKKTHPSLRYVPADGIGCAFAHNGDFGTSRSAALRTIHTYPRKRK